MNKINDFWIVPIGVLQQIYSINKHWQDDLYEQEYWIKHIYNKYDDVRHLFAMDLITAK